MSFPHKHKTMAMSNQIFDELDGNTKPYLTNEMSWLHSTTRMGHHNDILRRDVTC